jgi:hypothetical protein
MGYGKGFIDNRDVTELFWSSLTSFMGAKKIKIAVHTPTYGTT